MATKPPLAAVCSSPRAAVHPRQEPWRRRVADWRSVSARSPGPFGNVQVPCAMASASLVALVASRSVAFEGVRWRPVFAGHIARFLRRAGDPSLQATSAKPARASPRRRGRSPEFGSQRGWTFRKTCECVAVLPGEPSPATSARSYGARLVSLAATPPHRFPNRAAFPRTSRANVADLPCAD